MGLALIFSGCTFRGPSIEDVQSKLARGEKAEALQELENILEKDTNQAVTVEAARIGAPLSHFQLKNYDAAIQFYLYLANYSPLLDEKISSLKYLTQILMDHSRDYERAVEIIEKLLAMNLDKHEKYYYRLLLAKSNYQLARVDQAQAELDVLKEAELSEDFRYDVSVFESNVLVSQKRHEEAAKLLKSLIKNNPTRAKVDGLQLNLVSCYEDMNDLDAAIEAMEEMRSDYPDPQFVDFRIARLKERKKNMPGARGLKK